MQFSLFFTKRRNIMLMIIIRGFHSLILIRGKNLFVFYNLKIKLYIHMFGSIFMIN
jgi:hypothetical protein